VDSGILPISSVSESVMVSVGSHLTIGQEWQVAKPFAAWVNDNKNLMSRGEKLRRGMKKGV
jgi:hypothetical protein